MSYWGCMFLLALVAVIALSVALIPWLSALE
jgi:hypothetical protein